MAVDPLGPVADCQYGSIRPDDRIGIQFRFNNFVLVRGDLAPESFARLMVEEDDLPAAMVMDFPPILHKAVKDDARYSALLEPCSCVIGKAWCHGLLSLLRQPSICMSRAKCIHLS